MTVVSWLTLTVHDGGMKKQRRRGREGGREGGKKEKEGKREESKSYH
jgi:hypothetical protein